MTTIRNMRTGAGLLALASIMLFVCLQLTGCSNDDSSPTTPDQATAPTLPDAAQLQFDFSFFNGAESMANEKADGVHANFVNAYLRAVVLDALAELTLAAPVGAFAVALHTDPVLADDGSWDWVYNWRDRGEQLRIRLNGKPVDGHVAWEMHVSGDGGLNEIMWFSGTTDDAGREGRWSFYDNDREGAPVCGEINWGRQDGAHYLEFVSHEDDSAGDTLRFTDSHPDYSIDFTPGDGSTASFIRWNADGTGSLRVPDYNDGAEACWDRWQENVVCGE
ncbi:MAG: hypothetical protein GY838_03210 [bacterium]|nr:hypothetical protein [bacterium]